MSDYFNGLAKKHSAAGIIILNIKGELLVVKPSYRENWLIPGGVLESGETPLQGAIREVKEEIDLDITVEALLCIDHKPAQEGKPDSYQFIFLARYSNEPIQIDNEEITEYRFIPFEQAAMLLNSTLARRVAQCMQAIENGETLYLENGENPFGKAE